MGRILELEESGKRVEIEPAAGGVGRGRILESTEVPGQMTTFGKQDYRG
jgi:hypothetical protein